MFSQEIYVFVSVFVVAVVFAAKKTRNDIILIVYFRSWERVGYSLEGKVFKNVFSVIILSNDNQKKHCKIDNFQVPVDVVDKDTVVVAAAVAIAVAAAAFVL